MLIVKYAITALIVVIVSEVAKHSDRLGAFLASLPIISIMIMIWLFVEKQGTEKVSSHASYTFWYVLPTLPMFLLMPWMLKRGINFWLCLGAGCLLTLLCFGVTIIISKRLGVSLLP
jgi:hypothetical protein